MNEKNEDNHNKKASIQTWPCDASNSKKQKKPG